MFDCVGALENTNNMKTFEFYFFHAVDSRFAFRPFQDTLIISLIYRKTATVDKFQIRSRKLYTGNIKKK